MTGSTASAVTAVQVDPREADAYVQAMRRFYHPVARSDDLDAQGVDAQGTRRVFATELLGRRIVLARLEGDAVALDGTCPHRGAALGLGWINDDASAVVCPYHGFEWGVTGRIKRIAALEVAGKSLPTGRGWCVSTYPTLEQYGYIWVALAPEAGVPLLDLPEADDPAYLTLPRPAAVWEAGCGRIVEASLDTYHFAFTHRATIGDPNRPGAPVSQVEATPDHFYLEYTIDQPARREVAYSDDLSESPDALDTGIISSRYRFWAQPTMVVMRKSNPFARFTTLVAIHPLALGRSVVYRTIFVDRTWDVDLDEFTATQDLVNEEDRLVVESARPWELRTDLDAELHALMDRPTVAFRRWLSDLGISIL